MKDKLVKTGHKKPYYRFITTMRALGFSLLAVIALASPVLIAVDISSREIAAEEVVEVVSEDGSEESSASLLYAF